MTKQHKLLPAELSALVHNVELNRDGWWDRALERLILASVWLANANQTPSEVREFLKSEFGLSVSEGKVESVVSRLETRDYLIRLPNSRLRIAESKRQSFEAEIADAERAGKDAKAYFVSLVNEFCHGVNPDEAWSIFETVFLAPLIREIGANAYKMITGEAMTVNKRLLGEFQGQFGKQHEARLLDLVSRFLNPSVETVRSYVSRMLHAAFCVEASGLPEPVITKLAESTGKQIRFRLFVDTNFLFSLMELHDHPSNSAAKELKELIDTLGDNPKVDLYVTPRTIDEAKHSLSKAKDCLAGFPLGGNFNVAATQARFSGLVARYTSSKSRTGKSVSAEDWFAPYLTNFVPLARQKGVELFNEKMDDYATRQDVVDDIHIVSKIEERRGVKSKSFPMVEHDMILWHFVNDKRPGFIESPIDARDWILTLDFRFIGFDEHKQRKRSGRVPVCLHPTSLIQLLQFWVPRSKEFEEAILGSVRLPFLFHDFDSEAERTSLRILKAIGRLEDNDQIPEEAISHVMLNEGLRARLGEQESEEDEAKLIRDALVDELRIQAESHKGEAESLAKRLGEMGGELDGMRELANRKDDTIEKLVSRVSAEEAKVKCAEEKIAKQGGEIEEIRAQLESRAAAERRRVAISRYFLLLIAVVGLAGLAGWYGSRLTGALNAIVGRAVVVGFLSVLIFVFGHLLLEIKERKCDVLAGFWPFQQVKRLRAWLWGFVILAFFGGIAGNLMASRIDNNIKEAQSRDPVRNLPKSEEVSDDSEKK